MEFIKDMINTEGKDKMADIIANIHEIEKDYKRFYVDYNLNDPSEPVEFKLSSDLPVQIEAFSFEPPREIRNTSMHRQYLSLLSYGLSSYNEAIKNYLANKPLER